MPSCFVPFCRSGNGDKIREFEKKEGRLPTLFSVPKDENIRKQWEQNIKRGETIHSVKLVELDRDKHRVCELHFAENCFIRPANAEINCQETLERKKRQRKHIILKNNAIPTIFPNYPAYLQPQQKVTKRKAPPTRNLDISFRNLKKKKCKDININDTKCNTQNVSINEDNENDSTQDGDTENENLINASAPEKEMNNELQNKEILEKYIKNLNTENTIETKPKMPFESKEMEEESHDNKCFLTLCENLSQVILPPSQLWVMKESPNRNFIMFSRITTNKWFDISLSIDNTCSTELKIVDQLAPNQLSGIRKIFDVQTINKLLIKLDKINICCSLLEDIKIQKCQLSTNPNKKYCEECNKHNALKRSRESKRKKAERNAHQEKIMVTRKRLSQRVWRLKKKVKELKTNVCDLQNKYEKLQSEKVMNSREVLNLPIEMQETVKACLQSGKAKGPTGQRYTQQWMYECQLMRIKSPGLYKHLKNHKILPLPTLQTLSKYMKKLQPCYGFQDTTFQMMDMKRKELDPREAHGVLIIDEAKLSEACEFDKSTLKVQGFVDLGEHTPPEQKGQLGDHGLVIMYQSFMGGWVQVVGCFLSRGCANGKVLAKLVLEATQLLENVGYQVDGVVTDGASWNHNMWKQFGAGIGEGINTTYFCEHPSDPDRKLFFLSDFPHLLKCLRNNLLDRGTFKVPDGIVDLKYWDLIIEEDEKTNNKSLKLLPKLNKLRVRPAKTDRMKVSYPFKVFSYSAYAVITLKRLKGDTRFKDSKASSNFAKVVNDFCDAMNNSNPIKALRKETTLAEEKITQFLDYLVAWEAHTTNSKRQFLSDTTAKGFYVTILSTLELKKYLIEVIGFEYLLTRRLNQDALEHFFGMIRAIGGCNDHPDTIRFAQLVRLLSLYSLIKPPRGSNVSGAEMLKSLLTCNDDLRYQSIEQRKRRLEEQLDAILDDGEHLELIPDILDEHDYFVNVDELNLFVIAYVAGYVAKRALKWCNSCANCMASLVTDTPSANTLFIELKAYGSLTFPSQPLERLVTVLESCVQQVVGKHRELTPDYLFLLTEEVQRAGIAEDNLVGCDKEDHVKVLSKKIIKFFLLTRMHFLCRTEVATNIKTRTLRKMSKL